MKNALKITTLVALVMVVLMVGLGVNVFGVNVCSKSSNKIATLERIMVDSGSNSLMVSVKPTSSVRSAYPYVVDLYERGRLRASETVAWNQIQANTQQALLVSFPISSDEADAYTTVTEKQLRKTFSIKVHE